MFIDEDERKNHILERHFNSSVNNTQHPRQAFFYEEVLSPGKLFNTVIHELRNGLQPTKKVVAATSTTCTFHLMLVSSQIEAMVLPSLLL